MSPEYQNKPELVDLQMNGLYLPGGNSVDFSDPNITADQVRAVCSLMAEKGHKYFLPTIITAPHTTYERNIELITAIMDEDIGKIMPGFHLEGPYLSKECKGAHPIEEIRDPDFSEFRKLFEISKGRILLTTVAPDAKEAGKYIEDVVRLGTIVSIGHHASSTAQIEEAFSAGARAVTHVGNAWSRSNHSRKDTDVLAQLLSDTDPYIMAVPDGKHVTPEFLHYVLQALHDKSRFISVSDSSPLAGAPTGNYQIFTNLAVDVREDEDGVIRQTFPLSGSYLLLNQCLETLLGMQYRGKPIIDPDIGRNSATINPEMLLKESSLFNG